MRFTKTLYPTSILIKESTHNPNEQIFDMIFHSFSMDLSYELKNTKFNSLLKERHFFGDWGGSAQFNRPINHPPAMSDPQLPNAMMWQTSASIGNLSPWCVSSIIFQLIKAIFVIFKALGIFVRFLISQLCFQFLFFQDYFSNFLDSFFSHGMIHNFLCYI